MMVVFLLLKRIRHLEHSTMRKCLSLSLRSWDFQIDIDISTMGTDVALGKLNSNLFTNKAYWLISNEKCPVTGFLIISHAFLNFSWIAKGTGCHYLLNNNKKRILIWLQNKIEKYKAKTLVARTVTADGKSWWQHRLNQHKNMKSQSKNIQKIIATWFSQRHSKIGDCDGFLVVARLFFALSKN